MTNNQNIVRKGAGPEDLDKTDRRILLELQKNARLSNKELAGRIAL